MPKLLKQLCILQQFSTYWTFFILSYILGTKYLASAFNGAEVKKRWPLFCRELMSAVSMIRTTVFCLFFSSQPSFPSHHKWTWEKERFKDEINGYGQRIWKDVIKWDEEDNGWAGLRWRSTTCLVMYSLQCLVYIYVEIWSGKLHRGLCFKGEGFAGHINMPVYNID